MSSEAPGSWREIDEAAARARRRRVWLSRVVVGLASPACFCLFISSLFGVPQSFVGQWWMKPPRYPAAVEVDYAEGEICQMLSPGTYCYEWYYHTNDSVEEVIAYFQGYEWRFHREIDFERGRGRRFGGSNLVAEDDVRIFSNICGYQIVVHPSSEGDTEIYILERGAMGQYRESER